jgi:hypothetical protein
MTATSIPPVMKCVGCGCTEGEACEGGCVWLSTDPPVCSRCAEKVTPIFNETMGGALIDAARIAVMAAMQMIPQSRIVLPSDVADDAILDPPTLHNCLEEAMQWLNAARAQSLEKSKTPATSIHVVPR